MDIGTRGIHISPLRRGLEISRFSKDMPPIIYCASICDHTFARAGPFCPNIPLSYLHFTRSYSNAASLRKSPQTRLHPSQVVFNNLTWHPSSQHLPCPAISTKDGSVTPVPTLGLVQGRCSPLLTESAQRINCQVVQGQLL